MAHTPLFRNLLMAMQKARNENLKEKGLPPAINIKSYKCSRRKFLKTSAAIGSISLISGCTQLASSKANTVKPKIAIVGGGIAGLNAAYQLKKEGFESTIYEAKNRIGGRMLSVELENGLIVDIGAELINTDHEDMLDLVKELKVSIFDRNKDVANLTFPKEKFLFGGIEISESDLIEDLRKITEQITSDAELLDKDWDTNAPLFDKLSVSDYLKQHADKIKKPYILALFNEIIRTEFGVESHESTAIQFILVLPVIEGKSIDLLSYSDEVYSVIGGSSKISDAIGQKLGDSIKFGMALSKIKKQDKNYQLTFANDMVVEADMVIIAIPFSVLKSVTIDAPIPELLKSFINELELGSNEKVLGSFTSRFWRQDKGFTNAAWTDLGFSEVWDETSRQSKRTDGALNFYLGGNQARAIENSTNVNNLGKQFVDKLDKFIPGASNSSTNKFIKSNWTKSPFTLGGYASFKPGQLSKFNTLLWIEAEKADENQTVEVENLYFIGEHLSDEYYGFMNGGAQTGRLVAQLILEKVSKA